MKKIGYVSAAAVAALAGTAFAQNPAPAGVGATFALQFKLVGRTGTFDTTLTDSTLGTVANPWEVLPGNKVRFELRYRIQDNTTADTFLSTGLTAASVNLNSNATIASGGMMTQYALLAGGQEDGSSNSPSAGAVNPDSSGDPGDGASGLFAPFRTGLGGSPLASGTPNVAGNVGFTNVLPLTTASPSHNSTRAATIFWGICAFEFMPSAAEAGQTVTFSAITTQWNFFIRNTSPLSNYDPENGVVQAQSNDFVIHVTAPAPGTAALLGLGGLVGLRRRRA